MYFTSSALWKTDLAPIHVRKCCIVKNTTSAFFLLFSPIDPKNKASLLIFILFCSYYSALSNPGSLRKFFVQFCISVPISP